MEFQQQQKNMPSPELGTFITKWKYAKISRIKKVRKTPVQFKTVHSLDMQESHTQ